MTEVRPAALALTCCPALQRLNRALEGHDFTGQEILANEVLMGLATSGFVEIDHRDGYFVPAQRQAHCLNPASSAVCVEITLDQ